MIKKISISVLVILFGLFISGFSPRAISSKPEQSLPQIETITFVDYWEPSHAGPGPHPSTCSGNFQFTQGGLKWTISSVKYNIDESSIPASLSSAAVSTALDNTFNTWEAAEASSPSFSEDNSSTNIIAWQSLGTTTGVVAFAQVSYIPPLKQIVGFQMVFNSDLSWSTSGESGKYDLQNVATHESGHVEGLDHVNAPKDGLESMYKLTATGETIKQDLCTGDTAGIQALY